MRQSSLTRKATSEAVEDNAQQNGKWTPLKPLVLVECK